MRRVVILLFVISLAAAFSGIVSVSGAGARSAHRASAATKKHKAAHAKAKHPRHRSKPKSTRHKTLSRAHAAVKQSAHAVSAASSVTAAPSSSRLRFGVYPWAGAGAVNPTDPQVPDDPAKAMAAVKALQGGRSMTVHIYGQYTGVDAGEADHLISDAKWWSDNGLRVEMVLRYRPARPDLAAGYLPWVRSVATRLAGLPGMVALQIGNEPNNTGSAAAGDGAYPGAVNAIAHGIPAARSALVAAGRSDVSVGFNWAAGSSPCTTEPIWSQLKAAGGVAFTSAVGWVGIDVYPGTWSPPSQTAVPTAGQVSTTVTDSLRCLRTRHMFAAGLSNAAHITVAETGYPTDATRLESTQASVLKWTVAAVQSVSQTYGVTDLRWFSLRDANTGSGQMENGYGLLHDDYSAKPAFAAYQQIIAASGV